MFFLITCPQFVLLLQIAQLPPPPLLSHSTFFFPTLFSPLSVSLLWQTRRVRRNEEKPGRLLDTNVPIKGECKHSSWLYLSHTAQHFKYRHRLATLNSLCQLLAIYLLLMPSVGLSVPLRPPELNWWQSAGGHWLYRLHRLQIPPPPSGRSSVSPSQCFFCCCCCFLNRASFFVLTWMLILMYHIFIPSLNDLSSHQATLHFTTRGVKTPAVSFAGLSFGNILPSCVAKGTES